MRRGDIVLAEVHFTDLSAAKIRPAVVVSSEPVNRGRDRVVVPISSRIHRPSAWDVLAQPSDGGFGETGLHRASPFLCAKLITLDRRLIRRRLGTAAPYLDRIEACIRSPLAL